jgi:arylsulfatase A-like enzyme
LLETLRKSGALENTIIVYTTDNGPEHSARAYGGTTPFRGEKMTTYEGGVRVPAMVSWPGHIPAGQLLNGIQAHMDLFTTLAAAAGVPDVAAKMRQDRNQYIDGVNNLDYWTGKSAESARTDFIYYYESQLTAIRYKQWKAHFATKQDYYAPMVEQTFPILFNLRSDPYESWDDTGERSDMLQRKTWLNGPMQAVLRAHIGSLMQYPPVQKAKTLDFSRLLDSLQKGSQ